MLKKGIGYLYTIQTDSDTPRDNIFNTCELPIRIVVFVAVFMIHEKDILDDSSVVKYIQHVRFILMTTFFDLHLQNRRHLEAS